MTRVRGQPFKLTISGHHLCAEATVNKTQSEIPAVYPAVGKTQEHISGARVMLRAVPDRKEVGEKKMS